MRFLARWFGAFLSAASTVLLPFFLISLVDQSWPMMATPSVGHPQGPNRPSGSLPAWFALRRVTGFGAERVSAAEISYGIGLYKFR
jgi:hypothetical protein